MSELFGYEKLEVWQLGMDLVEKVYLLTFRFPASEQFGLTSQMRRAAVSIPANIAEGYGRGGGPSFSNFVRIARGSLYETRTLLDVCQRIKLATSEEIGELKELSILLSRKIDAFLNSLSRSA